MGQTGNLHRSGTTDLASGLLDARGFVYAARAWPEGQLDAKMGLASLACFAGGLTAYIWPSDSCRTPASMASRCKAASGS